MQINKRRALRHKYINADQYNRSIHNKINKSDDSKDPPFIQVWYGMAWYGLLVLSRSTVMLNFGLLA